MKTKKRRSRRKKPKQKRGGKSFDEDGTLTEHGVHQLNTALFREFAKLPPGTTRQDISPEWFRDTVERVVTQLWPDKLDELNEFVDFAKTYALRAISFAQGSAGHCVTAFGNRRQRDKQSLDMSVPFDPTLAAQVDKERQRLAERGTVDWMASNFSDPHNSIYRLPQDVTYGILKQYL